MSHPSGRAGQGRGVHAAREGQNRLFGFLRMGNGRIPSLHHMTLRDPAALSGDGPLFCRNPMGPVPDLRCRLPHRGQHHFEAVLRVAVLSSRASQVPESLSTALEAGKRHSEAGPRAAEPSRRGSEARSRASESGRSGPEGRFDSLEVGMNQSGGRHPRLGSADEPSCGGKRTKLGTAAAEGDRDRAPGAGPQALKSSRHARIPTGQGRDAAVRVMLSLGDNAGPDILGRGIAATQGIACDCIGDRGT